jgi:hypothetical protein
MYNGRKNTVIGLTAIFTFVLVELAAIFCTVGASVPVRRGCAPAVVERGLRLKLGCGTVTSCKYRGPFTYIPRNFRLCEIAKIGKRPTQTAMHPSIRLFFLDFSAGLLAGRSFLYMMAQLRPADPTWPCPHDMLRKSQGFA